MVYDWIIANKELIKIFYGLIITLICLTIVLKSDRLFRLSFHNGIRFFRNAFFFYGIAFIIRYLVGGSSIFHILDLEFNIIKFFFEYFLIMAGFFLLYSLIWKKVESSKDVSNSSLFNVKIAVFHLMALILASLDFIWKIYYFLFLSQVILFACISVLSYLNYQKNKKHKFPRFYFIAMLLSFLAWTLNGVAPILLNWNQGVIVSLYLVNIIVFIVFLYGVIKVTK